MSGKKINIIVENGMPGDVDSAIDQILHRGECLRIIARDVTTGEETEIFCGDSFSENEYRKKLDSVNFPPRMGRLFPIGPSK